jgi:hypothetical protein
MLVCGLVLVGGMHVGGSAESLAVVRCVMSLSLFRKGRERGEKKSFFLNNKKKNSRAPCPPADRVRAHAT